MRLVKCIIDELFLPRLPFALIAFVLIGAVLITLPASLAFRAWTSTSTKPPIHLIQDMDVQPRFDAQKTNAFFADDNRSMRLDVPGTVARGELIDDGYDLGYATDGNGKPVAGDDGEPKFYAGYPEQIDGTSMVLMRRGRERFNVFCYPCHGQAGAGNGPVSIRAGELASMDDPQALWTPASDLNMTVKGELSFGEKNYPNGKLFNTISNGIRNMPGYHAQIDVEDRWAIVLYVRALQQSQHATLEDVPADKRDRLK
jgi:mono/diheme cytochrome c family protein